MFRLQENVPEIYVNKSRDFQLFCRLYDACFNNVKFSTDSLARSTSTYDCDARLLELLKTKLGLFTAIELDEHELRCLLSAFPTIMRYKGSRRGVEFIKILFMKMYPEITSASVEIDNINYVVKFFFSTAPRNDRLLFELCKYVLPTGYIVTYAIAEIIIPETTLNLTNKLEYHTETDKKNHSQLDTNALVGIATVIQGKKEDNK